MAQHWPLWLGGLLLVTLAAGPLIVNARGGGETQVERRIERVHALSDAAFARELGVLLGPPFLDGNRVTTLLNGDQIFPAMLAAIRGVAVSITFENCIYWSGDIGRDFADALAERARHGVKVHVLLDWVGSAKMDAQLIEGMTDAGIAVHKFHPPHWTKLGRLNNRTHRKLLVVDGRLAFTGGVGTAAGCRRHARTSLQQLAQWRQREHAADVPAGHRRGDTVDRLVGGVLRSGRIDA